MVKYLKPFIKELRYRFSTKPEDIKFQSEVFNAANQWNAIVGRSEDDLSRQSNKSVLFVTGYGLGAHFQRIEPLIMMGLYTRGCKITSLYCNKAVPSCEFNMIGNNNPPALFELRNGITEEANCHLCKVCKSNIEATYSNLPVELAVLTDYINLNAYQEAVRISKLVAFENFREFVYEGIRIGEEAFASILRVTFMGEVQDTHINRSLVQRFIVSGILTAIGYEKAMMEIAPDRIVCIHGIYQTHGLAVKVANKLGIPVIVVGGGGIRKDTVVVCHNETYHHQLVNESNEVWEQFNVSKEEKDKTINYALKKRSSGNGADYLSYHPNPIENSDALYNYCKINRERKIVSLYTNVIWDAQILYEGNVFQDIFDWLFLSIEELGKNENIWVVIRIHPAESKGGLPTRQPMLSEIYKRFPVLPDNIRIIPPESDLSSYTLVEESAVNIIYGTKMGLEIGLMKRPLLICGETFSRNKGYGIDITNKAQYLKILTRVHDYNFELDSDLRFEKALNYAHFFYFRKMMDMPFDSSRSTDKLTINSLQDLFPGKNETVDVICNGILNLSPFYIGSKEATTTRQ
jgi:hypothetical protein